MCKGDLQDILAGVYEIITHRWCLVIPDMHVENVHVSHLQALQGGLNGLHHVFPARQRSALSFHLHESLHLKRTRDFE